MTPQERAEWVRFYMEERIAEGYSTMEAQSYAVHQLALLEERQEEAAREAEREKRLQGRKEQGKHE